MQDDFPTKGDQIQTSQDATGMMRGLRAAQEELKSFNQYSSEYGNSREPVAVDESGAAREPFQAPPAQDSVDEYMDSYARRIYAQKSKLEELRTFITESKDKIDKKLERINQLEASVKKMKENMRVLDAELSSVGEFRSEIARKIKEKLK